MKPAKNNWIMIRSDLTNPNSPTGPYMPERRYARASPNVIRRPKSF